jgi:K+-transporting ATPase ATPase B chain
MQVWRTLPDALRRFDPRVQWRNPVLFLVWLGAAVTTVIAVVEPFAGVKVSSGGSIFPAGFTWLIAVWLWLTVLFPNIAESLAEGRGRAEVEALRRSRDTMTAHRLHRYSEADAAAVDAPCDGVKSTELQAGDVVVVGEGEPVPADGEVIWGIASVNESAVTGESAPVIRESGGNRSAVTAGTSVVSDRIVVRVTAPRGDNLIDRMVHMARGARRQKAPTELALNALLAALSLPFVIMALTLNAIASLVAQPVATPILVAMVACLVPGAIAALVSVTGAAGLFRLLRSNVLITSRHALETAGEVTTVVIDKTGTITQGERRASEFIGLANVETQDLAYAAAVASIGDDTSEGISTIDLARRHGVTVRAHVEDGGRPVPFSANTRMSGYDLADGTQVRKGAESAVLAWLKSVGTQQSRNVKGDLTERASTIARSGGTPLAVALRPPTGPARALGVIDLKDTLKNGVRTRMARHRAMGIRTVMVTGDNPLTAAAIAREAGVADFLGDATPEDKLAYIRQEQAAGHFVAMTGDGTNDAPALAQADIGISMNTATTAAKKSANMVVLDDDPTRLIDIVKTGRWQRATRGALTTFSITNDLVKYLTIVPALFVGTFPQLELLNILRLHSPASAILSTVIFNALVIIVVFPMAVLGVPYRAPTLAAALNRNLLINGLGGVIAPLIGIKLIDLVVTLLPGY